MMLVREMIAPKNDQHWLELRTRDITSTEVSALFNCCPYFTAFELWHRKKDAAIVSVEETERMKWGTRLQDAIAWGIAEDNGWKIRRLTEYGRIPELRMGASFDYGIEDDGLLEVKNVDGLIFRNNWAENDDGTVEAPPHIELQLQHQLLVSGRSYGYIAALVGGNRIVPVRRKAEESIQAGIMRAVADFWESVKAGVPPEPDFERDAAFISELYGYADPNKIVEATEEMVGLAREYQKLQVSEKEVRAGKDRVKAQLLTLIGDAEKVKGPSFSISAGVVGPTRVEAFERKAYRNFKVTFKKEKPDE